MVKKLLRQEFNYYSRTLIFILPAVLFLGMSTRVVQFFEFDHAVYYLIFALSIFILSVSSIVAVLASEVLGVVRFYKNLYTAEGYLTFTLPVTNHQHIISKVIAHVIAVMASIVTVIIAWTIAFFNVEYELFTEIVNEFSELFDSIDISYYIGHFIAFGLEFLLILIISSIGTPLLYYTCISIGQTAKKHRILTSIGVYYLYNIALEVIATAISIFFVLLGSFGALEGLTTFIVNYPLAFFHILIWLMIIVSAGFTVLCYYINLKIMNNKLNLE